MKFLILCILLITSSVSFSQSDSISIENEQAKKDITQVIENLFNGMKSGDSSLVSSTFHPDIRMMSSFVSKQNGIQLHEGSSIEFLEAIASQHDEIWDEQYSNVQIHIDDNIAQIWMDYSFYIDEKFSHCGVNALQLVKDHEGWKILQITDTRRRQNCN